MIPIFKEQRAKFPKLEVIIWFSLALAIAAYGLFESFDLIRGPSLNVYSPIDGSTLTDALVKIEGKTARIAKIEIAGKQIFAERDGRFSESLLLGSGYNIIEVKVEDQFGRSKSQKLRLVLK